LADQQKISIFDYSPELARQFDDKRNYPHTVHSLTWKSSIKVWWRCYALINGVIQPDHTWKTSPQSRTQQRNLEDKTFTNCPFCLGLRPSASYNLAITHPDLIEEWHPTLNGDLTPQKITRGSTKIVWWICREDPTHVWDRSPNQRTSFKKKDGNKRRMGCIYCEEAGGGRKASKNYSFASEFPHLLKEWHPTLNGEDKPEDFTPHSQKKKFWICLTDKNHPPYPSTFKSRASGIGCPKCAKVIKVSSKIEALISFELSTILKIDVDDHTLEIGGAKFDVDIIVRDIHLAIEYDGSYFHKGDKDLEKDSKKNKRLNDFGWTVLRIREEPLKKIDDIDLVGIKSDKNYYRTATKVIKHLGNLGYIPENEVNQYLKEGKIRKRKELDEYVRSGSLASTGGKAPIAGRSKTDPEKVITIEEVLKYSDDFYDLKGHYPGQYSESISIMNGDSFRSIDASLRQGFRGLPKMGGLAGLLEKKRGYIHNQNKRDLTINEILEWMIKFYQNSSPNRFPTFDDQEVEGVEGEKWCNLNSSLSRGGRGLDKGWSLKKLEPWAMKKM
jgi:hypothetical protein